MKSMKVLNALENGPKTVEEIAKETGLKPMEVKHYLLRFAESGKVESYQQDDKLYWKLKGKDELEEEFKYV